MQVRDLTWLKERMKAYSLSPREVEVLHHLIRGLKNDEIALKLYVTVKAVKFHVTNIYKKTGCFSPGKDSNRVKLILLVIAPDLLFDSDLVTGNIHSSQRGNHVGEDKEIS
jgi:DNA-binding NarL/FixJ family response regulator